MKNQIGIFFAALAAAFVFMAPVQASSGTVTLTEYNGAHEDDLQSTVESNWGATGDKISEGTLVDGNPYIVKRYDGAGTGVNVFATYESLVFGTNGQVHHVLVDKSWCNSKGCVYKGF